MVSLHNTADRGRQQGQFTPGPESIRGPKQCWTRSSESGSSFTSQCIASLRWSFCCIQLISSQPASWFLYAADANLCTPYLMQSSARVPYVMHFSEITKDRNHKVCTVCMHEIQTSEIPRTLPRACKIPASRPNTICILWAPFLYLPWALQSSQWPCVFTSSFNFWNHILNDASGIEKH